MADFKISLHYRCNKRTFSEIFGCTGELDPIAVLNKLDTPAVYNALLAFRPAGTVLAYATSSQVTNTRNGGFKLLNKKAPGVVADGSRNPDVVNTAALCRIQNNSGRIGTRMVRCWRDDYTHIDADGVPDNTANATGALDAYVAALNVVPAYGALTIAPKSLINTFPLTAIRPFGAGATQITLSAGDFGLLGITDRATPFMIQGKTNRNLLGIKGRYYALAQPASPNLIIDYKVINAPDPPADVPFVGLVIRKVVPGVRFFNKLLLLDWRSRKTTDPIDRGRGRGRSVSTRR